MTKFLTPFSAKLTILVVPSIFVFAIYFRLWVKEIYAAQWYTIVIPSNLLLRQEYQEYLLEPSRCGQECFYGSYQTKTWSFR
jgi:hypothetical protein